MVPITFKTSIYSNAKNYLSITHTSAINMTIKTEKNLNKRHFL